MENQAEICETYQLKWTSYSSYMHSCIANSIYNDSHADVALVTTDGHQILAHRFVLSYSSMFLAQILKLHRKVTTTLPLMIVLPPEIDNKSLKILVRYMYSGEAKVQKEILQKVLRGGDILQIKGLYREKEDINEKNFKVSQNAQRPASAEQPTPPPLIPSTPTPPPLQPPPLVPTTSVSPQKTTIQSQKVSTASSKTQPGILKKAASSTSVSGAASAQSKVLPSSPGSKLILVQKPKESQQTYSNQRQKVLNFTILQNFDKNNTKKEDGTKQMTILNKALTQSKNDNEDSNEANVKMEPKETNNLQYLMVKDEPLDWTDAEMEIIDSKEEEIFEEMTVKSEENAEHSDDSIESGDILEFSPLTCELCTETFTVPADWVRHVQTHTDMLPAKRRRRDSSGDTYENDTYPELMCDLCQKSFSTPAEWVRHIQSSHSEFELFMSNKKNPSKKAILPSTPTTSNNVAPPTSTSTSTVIVDDNRHCDICDKDFSSHASMIIHQRRHTGEKPFACYICPRQFNVKSNLLRHLRTLHNKLVSPTEVSKRKIEDFPSKLLKKAKEFKKSNNIQFLWVQQQHIYMRKDEESDAVLIMSEDDFNKVA